MPVCTYSLRENEKCKAVLFCNRSYNAIISECTNHHPNESGGILLGYVAEDGTWIVMETIPPGLNHISKRDYFEYDREFVGYLSGIMALQYKKPLQMLGIWHSHPAHIDYFSSTDNITNREFARIYPDGIISGIATFEPAFSLTMYHVKHTLRGMIAKLRYSKIPVKVGDKYISNEYFALRYID